MVLKNRKPERTEGVSGFIQVDKSVDKYCYEDPVGVELIKQISAEMFQTNK